MTRNEIDKVFELCLLLVTVIAAAELQYASFVFSKPIDQSLPPKDIANIIQSNAIIVNSIFRWTSIAIFILVLGWIITRIFPSADLTHHPKLIGIFRRRYLKEFCWAMFGNLFVMEIINF